MHFSLLHVLHVAFISVFALSCTVNLYTDRSGHGCIKTTGKHCCTGQTDSEIFLLYINLHTYIHCSALVMCCVNRDSISMFYCLLAAGGSGQEISTNMDSDPLEQSQVKEL